MLTNYDRRKFRVKNNIAKNNKSQRPKICVSRSNKNIYVQLVDVKGVVLKSFSTQKLEDGVKVNGVEKAKMVGREFAKICLKDNIAQVVFDRGAYAYSGRIKALAEACREEGLQF